MCVCVCLCLNWRDFEGRQRKVIIEGPLFIFRCSAVVCFMITAPRRGNLSKKKIQNNAFYFCLHFLLSKPENFPVLLIYVCKLLSKLIKTTHSRSHVNFGEWACRESKTFKGESWCSYLCYSECCLCICTLGGTLTAALICLTLQTPNKCKEKNRVDVRRVKKNIRGEGEEKRMAETKEGQKEGRGESERKWKGRKWRSKMSKGHKCAGSVCACGAVGGRGGGGCDMFCSCRLVLILHLAITSLCWNNAGFKNPKDSRAGRQRSLSVCCMMAAYKWSVHRTRSAKNRRFIVRPNGASQLDITTNEYQRCHR